VKFSEIKLFCNKKDIYMLFIEHNLDFAKEINGTVLELSKGKLADACGHGEV